MTEDSRMDSLELAEELIAFPTVSPIKDLEIFEFVKLYLEGLGIEATIHDFEGVKSLTASIGSGSPHICLNGHLDVVEPGEGWEVTEPFEPRRKDGRLYGRGATDMKGAAAALINALVDLKESEFEGRATLMLAGDEEIGGENGTARLVDQQDFDYAIVGEPTDLDYQVGVRGVMWFDIKVMGEGIHASRAGECTTVMDVVPDVLEALNSMDLQYDEDPVLPDPVAAVTTVESDETYNSVPSAVNVGMDIRYVHGQTPDSIQSDIEKALGKVNAETRVQLKGNLADPVKVEDRGFLDAVESVLEGKRMSSPSPITDGGTSDGRFFSKNGTPFVEIGLDQEPVHRQDEYCSTGDLMKLAGIYRDICLELAAKP